jgi:hypothetical protein
VASRVVSLKSLSTVIERHGLKPGKDGNYHITLAMAKEAEVLDVAAGDPGLSPQEINDLKAAGQGLPQSTWRPWCFDEENGK